MINKHIEIVSTSERGLSSMGAESRRNAFEVLTRHYAEVSITIVNTVSDLEALVARAPDLVFLGMKFLPMSPALGLQSPKKLWIGSYLERYGIAYTGSDSLAHALEFDKSLAKQCVVNAGLQTSPFYVAKQNQLAMENGMPLRYPVFIKPTNRGGGAGIDRDSVADNSVKLQAKVASISALLDADSLVEEYLPGREFSVTIMKGIDSAEFSVIPLELVAEPDRQGVRMLSAAVKQSNTERVLEVADGPIRSQLCELAVGAFTALGARDYGRIDIRLNEQGQAQFLEANLMPSLISGYGTFPKACVLGLALDYESMLLQIVELGMARCSSTNGHSYDDAEVPVLDTSWNSVSV
jgi:D-alanine-D-alanine ligase